MLRKYDRNANTIQTQIQEQDGCENIYLSPQISSAQCLSSCRHKTITKKIWQKYKWKYKCHSNTNTKQDRFKTIYLSPPIENTTAIQKIAKIIRQKDEYK